MVGKMKKILLILSFCGTNIYAQNDINFEENIMQLKQDNSKEIYSKIKIEYDSIPTKDTLYIMKKHRFLLWTYYDKNTVISGVSLGFGQGARNVTTNGIKISVTRKGTIKHDCKSTIRQSG